MPLPELSGYSRIGLIGKKKNWLHLCRLTSRILEFGPSRLPNVFSLLNIEFQIFSRIKKKKTCKRDEEDTNWKEGSEILLCRWHGSINILKTKPENS